MNKKIIFKLNSIRSHWFYVIARDWPLWCYPIAKKIFYPFIVE